MSTSTARTARIAILGAGVMGETLLSTVLSAGHPADEIVVAESDADRSAHLRETHGVEVTDAASAVRGASMVLVVVKPQDVTGLLEQIADDREPNAVVVSFAAGVPIAAYQRLLGSGTAVVRVMPNTPVLVGEGVFGVTAGPGVGDDDLAFLTNLLATAGEVVVIDEDLQDALTALSGSGPAYVFYLAEAMIEAGIRSGLDPAVASALTTQTLRGAAALLEASDVDAAELRRRVTSPNGTTAAAIDVFDERGVKDALVDGILSARRRSAELAEPPE